MIPSNKLVNYIASTTFGVYLLHDGILQSFIWKDLVHAASIQGEPYIICYMLGWAIVIYVFGVLVDSIRQIFEKFTLGRLFSSDLWCSLQSRANSFTNEIINKFISAEPPPLDNIDEVN